MHLLCHFSTVCYFCFLSGASNKVVNSVFNLYSKWINYGIFVYTGLMLPRLLIDLPLFSGLHLLLWNSHSGVLISGIPRSAGPFLEKKVHGNSIFLCLVVIPYVPNCGMLRILCKCNLPSLFIHLFNFVNGILGNSILNMLMGIRLLLPPVSILKSISAVFWLVSLLV